MQTAALGPLDNHQTLSRLNFFFQFNHPVIIPVFCEACIVLDIGSLALADSKSLVFLEGSSVYMEKLLIN